MARGKEFRGGQYGNTRGKEAQRRRAERRSQDPRYQRAMEEARQAQADLEELIEQQQREPAVGKVAGAMYAAKRREAERKAAEAERLADEVAPAIIETDPVVAPKKFSVRSLPKDGEGHFPFAVTTARMMMKQGYNIQYVIEFTGVGYLDLDKFPLDKDGFAIIEEEDEEE